MDKKKDGGKEEKRTGGRGPVEKGKAKREGTEVGLKKGRFPTTAHGQRSWCGGGAAAVWYLGTCLGFLLSVRPGLMRVINWRT